MRALHRFSWGPDPRFDLEMEKVEQDFAGALTRWSKAESTLTGRGILDQARQKMSNKEYGEAIKLLTFGKRYYTQAMLPGQRWYMSGPFAVVSNRATCAEHDEHWNMARIDTRFTLLMLPDHVRSYERLPRIAESFFAPKLKAQLLALVKFVHAQKTRSVIEWRKLANRAVAMISMAAIIHSRMGTLTEAKIQELMRVGIEDMYTPITVDPGVLPPLPWLTTEDVERI
jgi:hypothetical protein